MHNGTHLYVHHDVNVIIMKKKLKVTSLRHVVDYVAIQIKHISKEVLMVLHGNYPHNDVHVNAQIC
jgi:hypothetical protein